MGDGARAVHTYHQSPNNYWPLITRKCHSGDCLTYPDSRTLQLGHGVRGAPLRRSALPSTRTPSEEVSAVDPNLQVFQATRPDRPKPASRHPHSTSSHCVRRTADSSWTIASLMEMERCRSYEAQTIADGRPDWSHMTLEELLHASSLIDRVPGGTPAMPLNA